MNKLVPLFGGMVLLAGCAASPDSIRPAYIPDSAYSSLSCQQLGEAELKEGDVLQTLTDKQHRARKTDTWGVLMVGLPLSEMTGSDVKGLLAREKGKMEALHRVQAAKGCAGAGGLNDMGVPGGTTTGTSHGTSGNTGANSYIGGTGGSGSYGSTAYDTGISSRDNATGIGPSGMMSDPGGIGTSVTPAANLPGAGDFRH